MNGKKIDAKNLREKATIKEIEKKRGYYKWWADKNALEVLLNKLGVAGFDDVKSDIESEDGLYCIYVGIACKEVIGKRLNHHINHKMRNSTLRRSLSCLVSQKQNLAEIEQDINNFIDKLNVEYFVFDSISEKKLHELERSLIQDKLRILNISENEHKKAGPFVDELKRLRKEMKAKIKSAKNPN